MVALLVLVSTPARAQSLEVTPLVGYTTSADIEQKAAGVDELSIDSGLTWGGEATYFISPRVGIDALWTYQATSVSMSTRSGRATLFRMTINQLHGNLVYRFGGEQASLHPFVLAGVGGSFLAARDFDAETKLSWTLGAGLTWLVQRHVGIRVLGRYAPTIASDSSSTVCDPFGFCQATRHAFGVMTGTTFRF
jgi:outer membrane protein W